MTAPAQAAGRRHRPILGPLSAPARIALVGTLLVAAVAIVLEYVVHADQTLIFIVSAASILGLAWSSVSRPSASGRSRAAGRRHPQRDVRQHRRADHRVLRAPGRPHRGRQGLDHRLDHRQPAARARRERAARRSEERTQRFSRRSPARMRRCSCSRRSGCSSRPCSPRRRRSRPKAISSRSRSSSRSCSWSAT